MFGLDQVDVDVAEADLDALRPLSMFTALVRGSYLHLERCSRPRWFGKQSPGLIKFSQYHVRGSPSYSRTASACVWRWLEALTHNFARLFSLIVCGAAVWRHAIAALVSLRHDSRGRLCGLGWFGWSCKSAGRKDGGESKVFGEMHLVDGGRCFCMVEEVLEILGWPVNKLLFDENKRGESKKRWSSFLYLMSSTFVYNWPKPSA